MSFILSKVLWPLLNPGNVLLLLICAAAVLSMTRWARWGRRVLWVAAVFAILLWSLPIGRVMIVTLENRFPVARELPVKVDGIIVLGGVANQFVTKARGQLALGGAVERLTEAAVLARRHPEARVVFTGGSGSLLRPDVKEAEAIRPFLHTIGLDADRVTLENESRNTWENAVLTRDLVKPKPGETWVLVTSAFHMPRSVGCFRKAGWTVLPYPVDFMTAGTESFSPHFNLGSGIGMFNGGFHEWVGLFSYWMMDRTDSPFPGPEA